MDGAKRVVPEGLLGVRCIEIHDIVAPTVRHGSFNPLSQVAVRVDEADAMTGGNVLPHHRLDERRLACPGLADDVHVREPVGMLDAELLVRVSEVGAGEVGDGVGGFRVFHPRIVGGSSRRSKASELAAEGGKKPSVWLTRGRERHGFSGAVRCAWCSARAS